MIDNLKDWLGEYLFGDKIRRLEDEVAKQVDLARDLMAYNTSLKEDNERLREDIDRHIAEAVAMQREASDLRDHIAVCDKKIAEIAAAMEDNSRLKAYAADCERLIAEAKTSCDAAVLRAVAAEKIIRERLDELADDLSSAVVNISMASNNLGRIPKKPESCTSRHVADDVGDADYIFRPNGDKIETTTTPPAPIVYVHDGKGVSKIPLTSREVGDTDVEIVATPPAPIAYFRHGENASWVPAASIDFVEVGDAEVVEDDNDEDVEDAEDSNNRCPECGCDDWLSCDCSYDDDDDDDFDDYDFCPCCGCDDEICDRGEDEDDDDDDEDDECCLLCGGDPWLCDCGEDEDDEDEDE